MSTSDECCVALLQQGDHLLTTTAARVAIQVILDCNDVSVIGTGGWSRVSGDNLILHSNYLVLAGLHCIERVETLADNADGCTMGVGIPGIEVFESIDEWRSLVASDHVVNVTAEQQT
ncbi:hypothetical protein [Mycolicibacterium aromaticivorans]|uniref:hypothetical protein n=1 Tax=Mycolicibacterium aromaticivorans TaxID=318425 RepID=UPI001ED9A22F|nr:hypothetical protein [Mycolicibacterium aromaticivorans]